MIPWLEHDAPFPPVESALRHPNGLLAAGGDLSARRLLTAYRNGIFPWYSGSEPLLWWSPDPRMVLYTVDFRVSRSLAKSVRNRGYVTRMDTAFAQVLAGCAGPRDFGRDMACTDAGARTWLSMDMQAAYQKLHQLGYAHSVETWQGDVLVGGLYGVAIGRMFFGESMFSRGRDASKVALAALIGELLRRQFPMIDCQMNTPHLASFGAREIGRREFLRSVGALVHYDEPPGSWQMAAKGEATLDEAPCHD